MSPTPGSGWSRSGTPRSPRATSASPTISTSTSWTTTTTTTKKKKKKKNRADASGKKAAAAARRNTHGPAQNVPRAPRRGVLGAPEGGGGATTPGGGAAVVTLPSPAAAAAARPAPLGGSGGVFRRRASDEHLRRGRGGGDARGFPLRSELHRVVRDISDFACPGTRSRGSLRRRPGTAPSGAGTSLGSSSRRRRVCSSTR